MDTCFYTSYKNITNFMQIYFIEFIQNIIYEILIVYLYTSYINITDFMQN